MRQDLGGLISDAAANLTGQTAPEDREAFDLIEQLIAPAATGAVGPGAPSGGGGAPFQVRKLTPFLKVAIFVRDNPWSLPVGLGAIVAGIFALGYMAGGSKQ